MAVSERNRLRYRAIEISKAVKWIFCAVPERFAKDVLRRWFVGWILRWLFLGENGQVHRAGEIVLAELRDRYNYSNSSGFSQDPIVMARNVGRREVLQDLFAYLNLDERRVQTLMRLDDGLE